MSENAKRGVLVTVIVLALVIAGFSASKMTGGEKPQVVKTVTMPAGFKSEREQDLENLAKQKAGGAPSAASASPGADDLGGPLGGK